MRKFLTVVGVALTPILIASVILVGCQRAVEPAPEVSFAPLATRVPSSNTSATFLTDIDLGPRGWTSLDVARVVVWDDFVYDTIIETNGHWTLNEGTHADADDPIIEASVLAGNVILTTGSSVTEDSVNDESQIVGNLIFQADEGKGIFAEARLNLESIADIAVFFGFTDSVALEEPFSISGTTITSTATDGVGLIFDTDSTNDEWQGLGVDTNTDTALVRSFVAPVANTFQVLRVEVDTAGTAYFFINGARFGSVVSAVTPTVNLAPTVVVLNGTTTSKVVNLDYLHVVGYRD